MMSSLSKSKFRLWRLGLQATKDNVSQKLQKNASPSCAHFRTNPIVMNNTINLPRRGLSCAHFSCQKSTIDRFMMIKRTFHSDSDKFPELVRPSGSSYEDLNDPEPKAKGSSVTNVHPVSASEIKSFLAAKDISTTDGYTCYSTTCPRISLRRTTSTTSSSDKLYINKTTGFFVCHTCKKSGNWSQFRDNTEIMVALADNKKRLPQCDTESPAEDEEREIARAANTWDGGTPILDVNSEKFEEITERLNLKSLTPETLAKFDVRALPEAADRVGLIFPIFNLYGSLIGAKIISSYKREGTMKERTVTRTIPSLHYCGLFGLPLVKSSHTVLVLTASEADAMAVHQETGRIALALPRGDSILPQNLLPVLEQFKEIVIWLGGDNKVWESAKLFASKLNSERCQLIRPGDGNIGALQTLQDGKSISVALKTARSVSHKSIITFRHLREEVFSQIQDAEQFAGIKWKRYTHLNKLLKGHRRGELTVFTGPTGSGKTTFISDYSLDLAMQGVNTLWGSFEINNARLMKTMLTQFAQMNLTKNINQFDYWADEFEKLPIQYLTFHGEENIKRVIDTMSHAVYIHDIAHVIVDNLQFMMGAGETTVDKFTRQDKIIGVFRQFATSKNCHVTLVIHPRKEKETEDLSISSIFGGAKASQEADTVLILQDKRLSLTSPKGKSKYLQIVKNRFDGDLGIMLLKFNKDSLSFAHPPRESTASKDHAEKKQTNRNNKKQRDPVSDMESMDYDIGNSDSEES